MSTEEGADLLSAVPRPRAAELPDGYADEVSRLRVRRLGRREFQSLFETLSTALVIYGDDRRIVDANTAACALLGADHEELVGRPVTAFGAPTASQRDALRWQSFKENGYIHGTFTSPGAPGNESTEIDFRAIADFSPRLHVMALREISHGVPVTRFSLDSDARFFEAEPTHRAFPSIDRVPSDDELLEIDARDRHRLAEFIERAIEDDRVLVYSQPIIDLKTGEICQEELLVRLQGATSARRLISPAEFLPEMERLGLTPTIDRFMLANAIRLAKAGRAVSVNVSAFSIQTPDLVNQITDKLMAEPDADRNLTFEITETTALAEPTVAAEFASRLASLGCGLALDDFGTGYGSFTELKHLELQSLKIDQTFVKNLATNATDQRVVRLIIHVAKEFGLTTTAEGVEDTVALQMLKDFGADKAQGYLIARPGPVRM